MNTVKVYRSMVALLLAMTCLSAQAGDWSANIAVSNNYIWRGLTQSENAPAVSGGIDYAGANGFYAGTWVSNVSYAPGDVFSYEHDVYFGMSGETAGGVGWDVGYLYFNYDKEAEFDFGEVYGSISYGGFGLGINILANTEANEGEGQDFGFGQATYIYADYATEIKKDLELAFHIGRHDGDFNEAFNGVPDSYTDFGVSLAKDGFTFAITKTDLTDAGPDNLDNDDIKFIIGYSVDFEL